MKIIKKNSYIVNIKNKILGRISNKISDIIKGKNKIKYQSNRNLGDKVQIVNIKHLKLTKTKKTKVYYKHSGYPGGLKKYNLTKLYNEKPKIIIIKSIKSMIKSNKLKSKIIKNLKLYNLYIDNYQSQKPKILNL